MSPRKPKAPTPAEKAEAACLTVENVLEAELGMVSRPDARALVSATRELAKALKKSQGLIDNHALNRTNPERLRIASDNLLADAATRHGELYRHLKCR